MLKGLVPVKYIKIKNKIKYENKYKYYNSK